MTLLAILGLAVTAAASPPGGHGLPGVPNNVKTYRLDDELNRRATDPNPRHTTRVIVELVPGAKLPSELKQFAREGRLDIINGQVLDLPNNVLRKLAAHPSVFRVHYDRPTAQHNYRTAVTVGARYLQSYGLNGAGVGIAVIDSGIGYHDDLNGSKQTLPYGNQRVAKFVDFVNGLALPYDDNGHGTHVAGIIAGNGYDSKGEKAGIAPAATLVSLKVLDQNGQGRVSRIIAALNWVAANAKTYNIKVVNLSVGAGVYESYWTDPLTLAAKAVTDQGITVVVAAGNMGKGADGRLQWGGITAPANAPWVLTVGASSTMGTTTRDDDQMADYSSAGPTYIDHAAKPDLVAPGTGTVSLAVPGSTLYATKSAFLLDGKNLSATKPYLALSGTSMAAPVVTGTVALMLQANPNLTPNLVKAILQYTAQRYPGYSPLRQGAGFLNSTGALWLSYFYAYGKPGQSIPAQVGWSREIIWGNHRLSGGAPLPSGNAWATNVTWGTALTLGSTGDPITWGAKCGACDNIVLTANADPNVVWGTEFDALQNVVWGTSWDQNVVWGTDCGGADCYNVVWGTYDALNDIVWGTCNFLDNIVWGTSTDNNVVWGTSVLDNIVWSTNSDTVDDGVIYPDDVVEPLPSVDLTLDPVLVPLVTTDSTVSGGGL